MFCGEEPKKSLPRDLYGWETLRGGGGGLLASNIALLHGCYRLKARLSSLSMQLVKTLAIRFIITLTYLLVRKGEGKRHIYIYEIIDGLERTYMDRENCGCVVVVLD